jgi:hypothetical protein
MSLEWNTSTWYFGVLEVLVRRNETIIDWAHTMYWYQGPVQYQTPTDTTHRKRKTLPGTDGTSTQYAHTIDDRRPTTGTCSTVPGSTLY